jgi:hypothetical protein
VRLNRNKSLVGAEIRNAMSGPVPVLIREIAKHKFFKSRVRFQIKRGQDKNTAAKLLLIEFRGDLVDTKRVHLDRFVEEAVLIERANVQAAADQVSSTLDSMVDIFAEKDQLLKSQGPITLYYWFVRLNPEFKHLIREFLVQFETERHAARTSAREVGRRPRRRSVSRDINESGELFFQQFDVLSRSVNDAMSLFIRHIILENQFRAFLIARGEIEMDAEEHEIESEEVESEEVE